MSKLEPLIFSIVELFEEYAGQDGETKVLSMEELKELLDKEVTTPEFQQKVNADDVNKAMDFLDKNDDGSVNFNEFSKCIAALARGFYKMKHGKEGKEGKEGKKGKKGKKGKGKSKGKGKGKGEEEEEEDEQEEGEEEEGEAGVTEEVVEEE